MTMTFMSSPSLLMTSESVTEGHPDKVCDQIADAILDEIIAHDPEAHVACEVTATTGLVIILGEISTNHHVDYTGIARQVTSATPSQSTVSAPTPAGSSSLSRSSRGRSPPRSGRTKGREIRGS